MLEKLRDIERQHLELMEKLGDPRIIADQSKYRAISKQYARLAPIIDCYREYRLLEQNIAGARQVLAEEEDNDMRQLAEEELAKEETRLTEVRERLRRLMTPQDPNDGKNVVLEIRSGTGGEEAALFAGDLFRMYMRFAERSGWECEILSSHATGIGGFKEVITMIEGADVYAKLKYEGGVHRVQRVPATEASGRIHTSAVTVAVMPEAEEVDVAIAPEDLRIDVYRSSGPGGQSVNTTDSAVRITHLPTNLVVTCQDEKSQLKNKHKALKILRARLLQIAEEEQQERMSSERKAMVGSGDRSAKIRTYNFPQGRITDHRINFSMYRLESFLDGDMDELIDRLKEHNDALRLQETAAGGDA
ncbi:peptide chain release factor 1 [bacterium]|nr:peptide chain release factor 1 [candidate division CSSED10-310 bacterium]